MEDLFDKYIGKLGAAGLAGQGALVMMGRRKNDYARNESGPYSERLAALARRLNLEALLFAAPEEPYGPIIDYLALASDGILRPQDAETRLFLRDIPVVEHFRESALISALSNRPAVVIPGEGILTASKSRIEEAFILYCAACFSCYVKFFADYLMLRRRGYPPPAFRAAFETAAGHLESSSRKQSFALANGPFASEPDILSAIAEAGQQTVAQRLVDATFGNVSYRSGEKLYISRRGSFLDELSNQIVRVSLANGDENEKEASSEYPSHKQIVLTTDARAVLHGHPRFAVILSLDCERRGNCPDESHCHVKCPRERYLQGIPIVSGEPGGGPYGISQTAPPALKHHRGVIVYGHGVFTTGRNDFNEAFQMLTDIETYCRQDYLNRTRL